MVTTYVNAIDEMFSHIKTIWEAESPAVVGYVPEMRWPDIQYGESPPTEKHYIRVTQQTVLEKQTGLRSKINGIQNTRYTTYGIIIVQLFISKSSLKLNDKRDLSVILRGMFRGNLVSGKVWFRNATINDGVAPEESWFRANVSTEYEFDEIE